MEVSSNANGNSNHAMVVDHDVMKLLPDELIHETDTVLYELDQQKALYHEFEKKMENKIQKVELENSILKKLFTESHQKNLIMQERMERVLKTLYNVFMANGMSLPSIEHGGSSSSSPSNHLQRLFSNNRLSVSNIIYYSGVNVLLMCFVC